MKIFLSHASRNNKAMLRELREQLPAHVKTWVDEEDLLAGDDLSKTLEGAIAEESDFVILFIDDQAVRSEWVRREIEWALAKEQALGRTFLVPVVLKRGDWREAWELFQAADTQKRKHLSLYDESPQQISVLAQTLSSELFALLSRDLDRAKSQPIPEVPKAQQEDVLVVAERKERALASEIRDIVHPHRENNPLEIDELMERMRSRNGHDVASQDREQFIGLLTRLQQHSLLADIYFDDEEIFLEDEHYKWKTEAFKDCKIQIARAASRMVRNGAVVALDGGSTTVLIAENLARNIIIKRLTSLTVVTNSMPAASELLSAADALGLRDDNQNLRVYIGGGRIRLHTRANVFIEQDAGSSLRGLIDHVGSVDFAFVGTNGICPDGFTTRTLEESQTKQALLSAAKKPIVVTDPSKFGQRQDHVFAPLDNAQILTCRTGYEAVIDEFEPLLEQAGGRIIDA